MPLPSLLFLLNRQVDTAKSGRAARRCVGRACGAVCVGVEWRGRQRLGAGMRRVTNISVGKWSEYPLRYTPEAKVRSG